MRKLFLILMTLTAVSWGVMAQTHTYSGSVVDAGTNEPLIGATILPIGGGQGTATDVDGHFTLTVPANVKQAKVTYVGYKEQTVALKDKMTVHLASTSTDLDQVVVVAYGTANKESLTGSVAVVGADEIKDRPVTSVTSALEGNAPGVQVNGSTGTPGSSPAIRIRGFNSFNSGAQSPLYVVDGVEFGGDIASLNPADIESMSVLKDAASCALYGSRGANGVILITTKRAKNTGNVAVTATVKLGAYERGLPFYDRMGAKDWMEASLTNKVNGAVTIGTYKNAADAYKAQAPRFVTDYCYGTNVFDLPSNKIFDESGRIVAGLNPYYTDLDWWDIISQTGFRQEYNINATGATEKFNAFSSVSYLKENGYIIKTDFERFTGRATANYNPVSYFRMGANFDLSYTKGNQNSVESGDLDAVNNPFLTMFKAPVAPYYAHNAETGEILTNPDGSKEWNISPINRGDNVAWAMRLDKNAYTNIAINATAYATAVIPYGFEFTVRGTMYRNKSQFSSYMNDQVSSQKGLGAMNETFSSNKSYTFSQTLNWSHDYGVNHVDAVLVHENRKYAYNQSYIMVSDQLLPDIFSLSNFKEPVDAIGAANAYTTESYLGRARYNYDQKYFGEFSINRDGSSQFYKDNRWGTFWSVGASWIISKEKFMQAAHWVNYLKLRAAYGSVGNNAAAGYQAYLNLYTFSHEGILPAQIGNKDLKWEATKTLDVALEGSLFNDRFNFSIGYFNKVNSDLIYNLTYPSSMGSTGATGSNPSIATNIGEMKNYGWELAFGVDIIRNRNVKWDFNIDFSFIKNEVSKLPYNKNIVGSALFMGKSLYEKYTYEYAGVDQMNGRALYYMNPYSYDYYEYNDKGEWVYNPKLYEAARNRAAKDEDGDQYVEINGVPYTYKSEYAGRKLMGSALPTVFGSFSSSVAWKGINFGVLFTYSLGGKCYDGNYASLMSVSDNSPAALHKDLLKAWTAVPEGMTETSANRIDKNGVPQINSKWNAANNASSSRWLTNASYLTLKNINISYDLPSKWMRAIKLQGINVGFSMDNVFIVAARKGMNPTYSFSGGQGAYFVPNRTYTFQLGVKF